MRRPAEWDESRRTLSEQLVGIGRPLSSASSMRIPKRTLPSRRGRCGTYPADRCCRRGQASEHRMVDGVVCCSGWAGSMRRIRVVASDNGIQPGPLPYAVAVCHPSTAASLGSMRPDRLFSQLRLWPLVASPPIDRVSSTSTGPSKGSRRPEHCPRIWAEPPGWRGSGTATHAATQERAKVDCAGPLARLPGRGVEQSRLPVARNRNGNADATAIGQRLASGIPVC